LVSLGFWPEKRSRFDARRLHVSQDAGVLTTPNND
jgi:hypothetical protein